MGKIFDESTEIIVVELCEVCAIERAMVEQMIGEGILDPIDGGRDELRFPYNSVHRTHAYYTFSEISASTFRAPRWRWICWTPSKSFALNCAGVTNIRIISLLFRQVETSMKPTDLFNPEIKIEEVQCLVHLLSHSAA